MLEFPALKNHWYIACRSSKLRRAPLKCSLLGDNIVLFRAAGKASALKDSCPHRSAPLSHGRVVANRIICPYHGWEFDGHGICQLVPGLDGEHRHRTRNVVRYHVKEQQGFVWVYGNPDEEPAQEPFHFPFLHECGFRSASLDFAIAAALPDALENFLDATHTHFVHHGIVRSKRKRKKIVVLIRASGDQAEAEYVSDGQDSGIIARLFGGGVTTSTDRFILPSIVQLEHRSKNAVKLMITLAITPQSDVSLRVYAVSSGAGSLLRYIQAMTIGKLLLRQVVRQDHDILKMQMLNKNRYDERHYTSTKLDIMRPHIMRLLRRTEPQAGDKFVIPEKRVEIMI